VFLANLQRGMIVLCPIALRDDLAKLLGLLIFEKINSRSLGICTRL